MKKKALFSSILSIVLCLTMISGATFALFTDSETVNIAVTAGTVDIDVTVENIMTKSYDEDEFLANTDFTNGGEVVFADDTNQLSINLITPGDAVKFDLVVTNKSDVDIQFFTKLGLVKGVELFQGMDMYINGEATAHDGITRVSAWQELDGITDGSTKEVARIPVVIELPYLSTSQNDLMGESTTMFYTVQAVQGNAASADKEAVKAGTTHLYNAIDLKLFSENVSNGNTYAGEQVVLMNAIDLKGEEWAPIGVIGSKGSTDFSKSFKGTFDGQNYTVSNYKVNNSGWAGLFGLAHSATIKNLKVEGVSINTNRMGGAIVGQLYGNIDNCHVKNATITAVPNVDGAGYDNGDKIGGIVGWIGDNNDNHTLKNCSVDGLTASAYRDLGGIAGYVAWSTTLENNKVANATLVGDQSVNFYGKKDYNVNAIWGRNSVSSTGVGVTDVNNTYENVTVKTVNVVATANDLAAAMTAGGEYALATDLTLTETITIPAGVSTTLYLNGKTIANANSATATHNDAFLVKGTLNVYGGTVTMTHVAANMLWNGATSVFDVTAGGVLNLSDVTVENLGGTDMNFAIHLNNWGEVTLNVENSTIKATYCPIRVFNSGYDMNNVTIENSTIYSKGNRAFWVHNYLGDLDSSKHSDDAIKARLNFDIFGNGNTYVAETNTNGGVIRYGFDTTVYFNANGQLVKAAATQDALNSAIGSNEDVSVNLAAGEYKMPSSGTTGTVAITGTKDTVIDVTMGAYMEQANVTITGVTIKTGTGYANGNGSDYAALYSPNVTYVDCTFVGPMRVGRDGAKFINCTFTELGNDYIWTYGQDVTFEGCTFNTDGKAILIYSDGGNEISKVTVKNCVFNSTQGAKAGAIANQNCAAIEIHNYGNGVDLVTEGNTYDSNFSGEWRIKTYETGKTKIFVNGTEYTTIAIDGKTMTIDAGKNVTVNP